MKDPGSQQLAWEDHGQPWQQDATREAGSLPTIVPVMTRIQKALQQLQPNAQIIPVKVLEQYLHSGDDKILAKLKPTRSMGWSWETNVLTDALGPPDKWTEEDRRLLRALCALGLWESLAPWLEALVRKEKGDEDVFGAVRTELESRGAPAKDIVKLASSLQTFAQGGKPNSAGRFVLSLPDADLKHAFAPNSYHAYSLELIGFLLEFTADRLAPFVGELLNPKVHAGNGAAIAGVMLQKSGARFEKEVGVYFRAMTDPWQRFHVAQALFEYDADKYRGEALEAARASLAGRAEDNTHDVVVEWMLMHYGATILDDIVAFLGDPKRGYYYSKQRALNATVAALGKQALPAVVATLNNWSESVLRLDAVAHLIAIGDGAQDAVIQAELEKALEMQQPNDLLRAVGLIARWKPKRLSDQLWKLLTHRSRPVREAAARALGGLGEEAVTGAAALLEQGKPDSRRAAVTILTTANTPPALKVLEKRLDEEDDDDVRDAILLGLESAWAASGRKVTRKDVEARIERAAGKLKAPPAAWIKEDKLPPLKYQKGGPLGKEAVRYLLYRQSRAKEIRPDVEAKPLYALIDRDTSGNFALEILKGFLGSKMEPGDRWALTVAGLLGDDRVVPLLNQQIRQWVDSNRGKMAEYAVQALSLLGTDAALLTIDALAIRYRTKNKNVGKAAVEAFAAAAEHLGITPEELGDRVVPWLGFEPDKPRIIDCGGRKIEARIGLDLKLKFHDVDKNKPVASLPKTAPKEVLAEFKDLGATLREVVKAQLMRLENLMVRQRRWPVERWRSLFATHPLLLPLAARLVWGVYDDAGKLQRAFGVLEDRTFTQASDEPFSLPEKTHIGMVHPLELSEEQRNAWQVHLADYEIMPPFPQLDRPVVTLELARAGDKALVDFTGTSINAMTFKGRAERLGWSRGSVADAGGISSYHKSFPAAGVDAFLGLDGMYIGIDMYTDIKLRDAFFVRSGSVKIGSYMYDEPGNEKDERVLRFGDVPPLVYSEVVGDLRKIAGKTQSPAESE